MSRVAIAGAAGVVLGVGIGLALGLTLASPSSPADTTPGSPRPDTSVDTTAPDDHEPPAEREPAQRRHVASGEVSAATLIESMDVGPVPSGDGTITGWVRLEDGTPVPGVTISAIPDTPESWDEEEIEDTPEAELESYARDLRWTELTRVVATSGDDGAFVVSGLGDTRYGVGATKDGYRIRRIGGGASRFEPGEEVLFQATALTRVRFVVRGPDGQPPESAQISLRRQNGSRSWGWSPQTEPVEVEPGAHTLTVEAGEHGQFRSAPRDVTFEEGVTDQQFVVDLVEAPGIGGTIRREGPDDRQGMQVWLARVADGSSPTPARVAQTGTMQHVWVHHGSPKYQYFDLAPGTYAIAVARQNALPNEIVLVDVEHGFVEHDLVVPDYDRSDCLVVVATAPDGSKLTRLSGALRWEHDGGSQSTGFQPIVRPDGEVWVLLMGGHGSTSGRHTVDVTADGYGTVTREFTPGPQARIEVQFLEPARLTVTVTGYLGSGAEGRLAVTIGNSDAHWGGQRHKLDAEGRVELPQQSPGTQTVTLRTSSQWGQGHELARREVSLVSGDNAVTLAMPALHTLTVELPGEVAGRMIGLSGGHGHGASPATPDETGRVLFDLLPAGEYTIQVYNGEGGTKTVTIPDTTFVRFD